MSSLMPSELQSVRDDLYEINVAAWKMSIQDTILSDTERVCQIVLNTTHAALDLVSQYVDLDYIMWIKWLLSPIIITFVVLPSVILVLIYVSALTLYIYKAHRKRLIRRLAKRLASYVRHGDFWLGGRVLVATLWDAHAWLWHGYELHGLSNLPTSGGCILLYYHGAIPLDYYYLVGRVLLLKETMINSVVDKFLFKVPGLNVILDAFCCTPGTVETVAEQLVKGKILGLAPGGVYEAQFGDNHYKILWRKRLGFAKAALKANVPILPVFTENIRESFRVLPFYNQMFFDLFEKTRLPLRPIFGGFPVKLRTHIGEPIYPEPEMTPEMMRDKCKESLEKLIAKHQRMPGSILRGIFDRCFKKPKSQ